MARLRKLSKKKASREALLKNAFKSLVLHKRIITTEARAKEVKRYGEKILTRARLNTLHAKREVDKKLSSKAVIKELFEVVVPALPNKTSGFITFQKVTHRDGDGSDRAALIIPKKIAKAEPEKSTSKPKKDKSTE